VTEHFLGDLVPKTVTYFANIYRPLIGSCGQVYASRELADQMAGRDRIACVEFTATIWELRKSDDDEAGNKA
jgi:hypothetical protein